MAEREYWTQRPTTEWREALSGIPRFHKFEMLHRTNLLTHGYRVQQISLALRYVCIDAGYEINQSTLERRSLHHDDPEVETTDIPSPIKRAMTPEQKEQLRSAEMDAVRRLATRFTTLPKETYISDQEEGSRKETVEDQIVDIADKLDGLCETLHELRCGNDSFWEVLENYRVIFSDLSKYPIYRILNYKVTTKREVKKMPSLSVGMLERKESEFWDNTFSLTLPPFYRFWIYATMANGGMFRTLAGNIRLFPGWEKELIEAEEKSGRKITPEFISLEDLVFGQV